MQALLHACIACSLKPAVDWIAASDLEEDGAKLVGVSTSFINLYIYLILFQGICLILNLTFLIQTPEAHAAAWKTLRVSVILILLKKFLLVFQHRLRACSY